VTPEGRLDTGSDGDWPNARADLVRIRLGANGGTRLRQLWSHVPDVREADYLLVDGRLDEARTAYAAELAADPDQASALIGLALSLPGGPGKQALLAVPELVRAVHRKLRAAGGAPAVEELAAWTGEGLS